MKHHLGHAMREARTAAGLNQTELGALLGVNKKTVSSTERGKRPMTAVELISMGKLFASKFEFATEALLSDIVADLATRVRVFLGTTKFAPEQAGKREWLQDVLSDLDHTHVAEIA